MKISSTILLNFLFLLVVSCSSSAKDVSGDSSIENTEESFLIDECLEDCSNSGFSLLDDDTPEMEESNSVFLIKGLGCNSLQYGTGFFVEENIVVTSAHVVAGVNSPEIFYNGIGFDLDFISFDPKYCSRHSGTLIESVPLKFFSIRAIKHLPTARPEPLIVCTRLFPSLFLNFILALLA